MWSDRRGRRKPFVVCGYGLSAVAKPLLALAGAWPMVLFCRFLDRAGKGVRTSARDALLTSSAPPKMWGRAFGFHRAMDTAGAVIGPLVTLLLLSYLGISYRSIFLLAAIPAALGVAVLAMCVKESSSIETSDAVRAPRAPLSPELKRFFLIYGVFALGNSSDAFLILKAARGGLIFSQVILAYVLYNAVYALAATPAGALADRFGRTRALAADSRSSAAVYLGFAEARSALWFWPLFAAYGFYGALAESSLRPRSRSAARRPIAPRPWVCSRAPQELWSLSRA